MSPHQEHPESLEHCLLTHQDLEGIAQAVEQGVRKGFAPEPAQPTPKWRRTLLWTVLMMGLLVAGACGVTGFTVRPPQQATFTATFATDTILTVEADPVDVSLIQGTVSGIQLLQASDLRVEAVLAMAPADCEALAAALAATCQQNNLIEVHNRTLELSFDRPISASINTTGASRVAFQRQAMESGGPTPLLVDAQFQESKDRTEVERSLQLRVVASERRVKIKANGEQLPIEIKLHPDPAAVVALRLTTPNLGVKRGAVGFLYAADALAFNAQLAGTRMQVEDTPDGVLALSRTTQKLGLGERLQLTIDRIHAIRVKDDRLIFDARKCENTGVFWPWAHSSEPCIVGAVRNEVVELSPVWFTLWNDWIQKVWMGFASGTVLTMFFQLLRRFHLWPS